MKKIIALVIALLIAGCAVFAVIQLGSPIMSMKKMVETLASSYDGHYDIDFYEMKDGNASSATCYEFTVDRTGDVFGGTIPVPYSRSGEDSASALECEGYFDLGSKELVIGVGSLVESAIPDTVIALAKTFGLMIDFDGYYVSLSQLSDILEAFDSDNDVTEIENILEQASTTDSILKNCTVSILMDKDDLKNTGLVESGYQYYKATKDGLNASIYFGCPKQYDASHLELMVYVDFTDSSLTDYAAVVSAKAAETSVSMPSTMFSDDQVQEVIALIEKVKSFLE